MVTFTVRLARALQSHSGFQGFVLDIRFCLEILDARLPKQFPETLSKAGPSRVSRVWGDTGPLAPLPGPQGARL